MDQTLSSYKIFYTVAKTGNISHAANELFISQPAISKAVAKLEANLNTQLFIRNSRGVSLTDEGKLLFQHLTNAFDSIDLAEEQIKKGKALGIGHIRFGVSSTLCKFLLLPYLKKFVSQYPHIKISIECHSTFQTLKLLEENKIDIGLIGKPAILKDFTFYQIQDIEDCFVTNKAYLDNLKLREEHLTDSNILSCSNLMLLDENNMTRKYIEQYFRSQNIVPSQILEVTTMDLLIEFAKIGLGVACVIKEFVKKELETKELIEIPLKTSFEPRQVGFCYCSKAYISDSMQKFIDFYENLDTLD